MRGWLARLQTPLLPLAYLFLVLSCFALYTHRILRPLVFHHAIIPGLSPIITPCIAILGLIITLATYAAACYTDPGIVTPHNAAFLTKNTPNDPVLWPEARTCTTCNLPRPSRAKHCPACGVCVARFDHHCMWINGCVGARNLRWFLLFLGANVLLFGYGVYAGVCTMLARGGVVYDKGVLHGGVKGMWRVMHGMYEQDPGMGQLVLLTGVAQLAIALLLGQHVWLLWSGVTSYEVGKQQGVGVLCGGVLCGELQGL